MQIRWWEGVTKHGMQKGFHNRPTLAFAGTVADSESPQVNECPGDDNYEAK
jgi:hypothetical protein